MLNMLSSPRAVAAVGASRTSGKPGCGVVRNFIQHGCEGMVYPINPQADEILGPKANPNVQS
jgi:acyl-CoA synthetase (NDP forming)